MVFCASLSRNGGTQFGLKTASKITRDMAVPGPLKRRRNLICMIVSDVVDGLEGQEIRTSAHRAAPTPIHWRSIRRSFRMNQASNTVTAG